MPTKRLSMRRIHRLMTLRFGAGAGTRAIARELGVSHSTVREYLARIAMAGISWPFAADVTDAELERRLFCKIACNNDPLRGDFRVQFRPL